MFSSVPMSVFVSPFLSAAFKPAHVVPDVFGRQMTLTHTNKNEHVLNEECEHNSLGKSTEPRCLNPFSLKAAKQTAVSF